LAAVKGASLNWLPQMSVLRMAIAGMAWEVDDRKRAERFAVRRTNTQPWVVSDALHDAHAAWAPFEAALFDCGRWHRR